MRHHIAIGIILVATTACANYNRPKVEPPTTEHVECAEEPAVTDEFATEHVDEVEYVNLCVRKECDATRLEYTRSFRNAAISSQEVEFMREHVREAIEKKDLDDLKRSSAELPGLKLQLRQIRSNLAALDPGTDFETVEMQIVARRALIKSREKTNEAGEALKLVHDEVTKALGEDPYNLVNWKEAAEQSRAPAGGTALGARLILVLD